MGAIGSIEELTDVSASIKTFKKLYPEAAVDLIALLMNHRKVGYKNIAKMFMGMTPEEVKG